ELGEPDRGGLLLHHLDGVHRVGYLLEVDVAVAPDILHTHEDRLALLVLGLDITFMAEPLHPVIQLDKGAKICEPLDTPDIDLPFLNIIQVAARAHAIYGYVIWILH